MMNEKPVLSIIMATHNNGTLASDAIMSVVNNMPHNCELLVINDGSTDESDRLIRELVQQYSHIRYYYQPKSGVSVARNRGIDLSQGDYLAFIDGDDLYSENFFNVIMPILEEQQYDIISYDSTREFDAFTAAQKSGLQYKVNTHYAEIIQKTFKVSHWQVWSRIFRRNIIGNDRFPENISYFEDVSFTPFQYLKSHKLCKINQILYYYRKNRLSVTETHQENDIMDMSHALDKFIDRVQGHPETADLTTMAMMNCYIELRKKIRKMRGYYDYSPEELQLIEKLKAACLYKNIDKKHKKFYLRIKLYQFDLFYSRLKYRLLPHWMRRN
ncbi:glycosyltransferase family 2 protein [Superficieibacter electus]|nr:glycosyltransferase [Superficieibacter electus]